MAIGEDDTRGLQRVALAVLALGAIVSVAALVRTWHLPITDSNSFRQTQTALTAYWIGQGGPLLSYETPVLGAPWAVPFELPLYQALVASVSQLGLAMDSAGRLVSWVFFALTLWQVHALIKKLGGSHHLGLLVCGLLLLSPLYVFWSRTFMMESTALFFSVAFVSACASHVRAPRPTTVAAMIACACLAGLVKVTTFVAFGLAGGLVVLWDLRRRPRWRDARLWLVHYAPVALAGVIAIGVVAAWVHHGDVLKADHPFAKNLVSTNLDRWNYGTLAQRKDPALWRGTIFGRTIVQSLGTTFALWATVGAAVAFGRAAIGWLVLLVALYVVPFMVFTNVQWVHHYYQYANALFVVAAVAIVAWHARAGWRRYLAYTLIAGVVTAQLVQLVRVDWPEMAKDRSATDTVLLRDRLADLPDGVVLVFGYDWSSEVAYYLRRRAINVPLWASRAQLESLRDRMPAHAGGLPIVALIDCPHPLRGHPELGPIYEAIIAPYAQAGGRRSTTIGACTVWR